MAVEIFYYTFLILMFLTLIIRIIIQEYIKHSKKYKNLELLPKAFAIVRGNRIIKSIDIIEDICPLFFMIEFFAIFIWAIYSAIIKDCQKISESTMQLFGVVNFIAIHIWFLSTTIANICYIFVYIKVIKDNKI